MANLLVNMLEHFPMEPWMQTLSDAVNFGFLILFTVEMAMKVPACHPP